MAEAYQAALDLDNESARAAIVSVGSAQIKAPAHPRFGGAWLAFAVPGPSPAGMLSPSAAKPASQEYHAGFHGRLR